MPEPLRVVTALRAAMRTRAAKAASAALLLAVIILFAVGYRNATADPIVRYAAISLPDWPAGAPPVTAVLISDVHAIAPDMPPARIDRIVGQINALKPDVVFITGDFVSDRGFATRHYDDTASIAPLAGLRARYGTVAVLGNHDHDRGAADVRRALVAAHILLLKDDARRIGPLVVGGTDDPVTGHENFELTLSLMKALGNGPRVVLAHGPSLFPYMPRDFPLMLVGHTHCGQIRIFGLQSRVPCGIERSRGRMLIVSAGLGASVLPLRFGTPPDIWLLRLGPFGTRPTQHPVHAIASTRCHAGRAPHTASHR